MKYETDAYFTALYQLVGKYNNETPSCLQSRVPEHVFSESLETMLLNNQCCFTVCELCLVVIGWNSTLTCEGCKIVDHVR